MFHSVKIGRAFEAVVTQIEDAIIKKKYHPGDRLPAERQLQEMFDVSRNTLREALRTLEQKGLIEIRRGASGGVFVKQINTDGVVNSLALLINSGNVSLQHLSEFRCLVEGEIAALAAVRADEEGIQQLSKILADAELCLDNEDHNWFVFVSLDYKFHVTLAEITGNPMYRILMQTIHGNIIKYFEKIMPRDEFSRRKNFDNLKETIAAIKNKDATAARQLAREHAIRMKNLAKSE